jgi:hypothetical protein
MRGSCVVFMAEKAHVSNRVPIFFGDFTRFDCQTPAKVLGYRLASESLSSRAG